MLISETFLLYPIKSATWFDIELNRGYLTTDIKYEICIISEFNSIGSIVAIGMHRRTATF